MIIIDWSYLAFRNLFIARSECKKTGEHYKGFFYHLILNNITNTMKKFNKTASETILALDSKSWRKEYYAEYKENRTKTREKDDFDWNEFFNLFDELNNTLKEKTALNLLKVERAEADDIAFIIAKIHNKDTILVSSDKDWRQMTTFIDTKVWDPLHDRWMPKMNEKEILNHILIGDSSDNIPNIKSGTQFSLDFLKYLKSKGIFLESVEEVKELEIFQKLYEEYPDKSKVYKQVRFGEVTCEKQLKEKGLNGILEESSLIKKNYERNKNLIDMRYIPKEIEENIIQGYNNLKPHKFDITAIFELQDWCNSNMLMDIQGKLGLLLK